MLLLMQATLFFLNIEPSSLTKNALAGRVKNWAVLVDKSTRSIKSKSAQNPDLVPNRKSAAFMGTSKTLVPSNVAGPPSTEGISFTGQTEGTTFNKTLDKIDVTTPDDTDDMVGGFSDEDLDDEMERIAALLKRKQLVCCPPEKYRAVHAMLDIEHHFYHQEHHD